MRIAVVASLAVALVATTAHASPRRVALVNGSDVLDRQIRIALSAWELDVERVDWTSLSNGMPGAAFQAREIAEVHKVAAVVWISETGKDHALWVYDADEGQIVTRPLTMEPTDAASAASLALTLKTLMRSTTAAPPHERIGAGSESPVGPAGVFRLEADGGARMLASDAAKFELRVGITGLWFPRLFDQYAGLAVGFASGPGVAVRSDAFAGRFLDVSFAPALRLRFPLGAHVGLEPSIGTTIHLTRLDGAAILRDGAAKSTRVDPSLDASLLFSVALTRGVGLGVRAGALYVLRYQRYLVDGQPILELSPLQLSASLVAIARFN